ncbi:hypothetical protein [Streptomyces varsoviensis]|uniref:Uncharacterized protein n=1 Tax=Streptomyces varsoviensis TaxID=67373 RepID=A0ABR5IX47_9ACTN|nr:hypothetical protein [Streptomyces varsoviensis]KOG85725.1 hypothetical protein ADK38_35055 [Streptomyces varsoviensis]
MSIADLNADAGRCWLDLGDPHRATTAIDSGLTALAHIGIANQSDGADGHQRTRFRENRLAMQPTRK